MKTIFNVLRAIPLLILGGNMETKNQVIEYLRKKTTVTLATMSENGNPITHPVAYVSDEDGVVYFATSKNTRKVHNIMKNQHVAYSVFEETSDLNAIRSIQMEGTASVVLDKEETGKAMNMLMEKFPFMKDMPPNPDNILIKVEPEECYFADYSKGFGHRDKIDF